MFICDGLCMARKLRIEYEGAIYHVTCRMLGDARSKLFIDPSDRARFLDSLAERVKQHNIRLYMYVLMNNHFHLVFETPEGNCSKFMHALSTSYTVYYNLRHNRHGHLFDGRYKSKLVDGDEYLLALSRYVHLNPVKVKKMRNKPLEERLSYLQHYMWSSYAGYIDKSKQQSYVEYAPVLSEMSGKRREWRKNYKEFVDSGAAEDDLEFKKILKDSHKCIGDKGFTDWVDKLYQELVDSVGESEDVSFRHISKTLDSGVVLGVLSEQLNVGVEEFSKRQRGSYIRALAASYMIRYSGKSQREVAVLLGIGSGSAVSKQLAQYRELLIKDKQLIKLQNKADKLLDEKRSNETE